MIKFSGVAEDGRNAQCIQQTKYILSSVPNTTLTVNEQELIPIDIGGHLVTSATISVNELGKQLLKAAATGNADEIKKLLSRGAPFTADWLGTSPLHLAAQNNHLEVAKMLLRAGISKDARTKVDRTPLHMAAYEGHVEIVEALIKHDGDIDCKDLLGMTPLHWAVQKGHLDIVEFLLRHGANINCVNKFDLTPLMIAKQINRLDIENILENGLVNTDIATQNLVIQLASEDNLQNTDDHQTLDDVNEDIEMVDDNQQPIIIPIEPSIINQLQIQQDTVQLDEVSQEEPDNQFEEEEEEDLNDKIEPIVQNVNITTENLSESLKLLQEHGIAMLQNEAVETNILNTVMESGHSVVLTDVGKEVLNSVKKSEQQHHQHTSQKEKKLLTVTPEEFLAMANDSLSKSIKPVKIRRVVMRKNKFTPIAMTQTVNNEATVTVNGGTDMELVMSQLIEARKTIEEMKIKLHKKEQEAERYKMQLKLLMDPR